MPTKTIIRSYIDWFDVWLDESLDFDWSLGKKFEFPNDQSEALFGGVERRTVALQALPDQLLSAGEKLRFRYMLGEAIALSLEGYPGEAQKMLDEAEQFAGQRVRPMYLVGSLIALFAVVGGAWLSWTRGWASTAEWQSLIICAAAGAVGAFLSVSWRLGRTDGIGVTARTSHYVIEGADRILIGVIGSLILGLGLKLNLVLGILNKGDDSGTTSSATMYGLMLAGLLAGASERLVPSFIDRLSSEPASPPPMPSKLKPEDTPRSTSTTGGEASRGDHDRLKSSLDSLRKKIDQLAEQPGSE